MEWALVVERPLRNEYIDCLCIFSQSFLFFLFRLFICLFKIQALMKLSQRVRLQVGFLTSLKYLNRACFPLTNGANQVH